MPADGAVAVHATAVAIGDRALLICGPSRSGKSRLAMALIEASRPGRPIQLIGDDRILLVGTRDGVMARPHPRIAGFIERRGLGIVAMSHLPEGRLAAIVELGGGTGPVVGSLGENFPVLSIVSCNDSQEWRDQVLAWWERVETATSAQQCDRKARSSRRTDGKD